MANLEEYLQAILDKIANGTETTLPEPSWNHEKYLAAIYEALSNGGGGGGGSAEPLIEEKTVFTQTLGTPESSGSGLSILYMYELDGGVSEYLTYDENDDSCTLKDGCDCTLDGDKISVGVIYNFVFQDDKYWLTVGAFPLVGDLHFVITQTVKSPALLDLYDENDPNGDTSYLPDGVEIDDENGDYVVNFDTSAAYDRLRKGQRVWVRMYDNVLGSVGYGIVSYFAEVEYNNEAAILFVAYGINVILTNYTGEEAEEE